MKYKISAIQQPNALTFYLKNKDAKFSKTIVFTNTHTNFKAASEWLTQVVTSELYTTRQRVSQKDYNQLVELHDASSVFAAWSDGSLAITRSGMTFRGLPVRKDMSDLLLKSFLSDPTNVAAFSAWSNYLNIVTNPNLSNKIIDRLFLFLNKNDLQITADGKVLAWKVVRPSYKDKYSNTIDNSVGATPTLARNKVNDDDAKHCSYGLHVCSWDYLRGFASQGDPVMQVEVAIEDIVSIPTDYNGEKVRVCSYKVVAEAGIWGKTVSATELPKLATVGFKA